MGQKMAYLEQAVLAHLSGGTAFTPPVTVYFLASIDAFDPTLTGFTVIEPTGGGYAQVAAANDGTTWSTITGSNPASMSNLIEIDFPTATASWGTILSVYVGDNSGNLLWGTAVSGAGIPINTGSSFAIPIGGFVIRET